MISRRYNFIYLHIPRTGGNSIQQAWLPYCDDQAVINSWQDGVDRFGIHGPVTPTKHATLAEYAKALGSEWENYRLIVNLRDPIDRALSYYRMPARWLDSSGRPLVPSWSQAAFRDLLAEIRPAVEFLQVDGTVIRPHHHIQFDSLRDDFMRVSAELGLPKQARQLAHRNRSTNSGKINRSLLDADMIDAITDRFQADYRLLEALESDGSAGRPLR